MLREGGELGGLASLRHGDTTWLMMLDENEDENEETTGRDHDSRPALLPRFYGRSLPCSRAIARDDPFI